MKSLPLVLGILAIATAIPAWVPSSKAVVSETNLVGKLLTRSGNDIAAEQVASLRVVTWDDSADSANVFEVSRTNGSWVIPSHYNYPADGGTRVGQTSGNMRGVTRGRLVTSDSKQYEELGVVDPLTEDTKIKGRGKRVVLKDTTGGVLLDLIVGKTVPDSDGFFFVRDANEAAVYTAKVEADISTRFVDWVETDLLKLKGEDIREILVSDYSVNEQNGSIEERSKSVFSRADSAADWNSPQTPAGKQANKTTVDAVLSQGTGLKLTGVRKFSLQWLTAAGFFPSDNPTLLNRPDSLKVNIGNKSYALFGNEGRVDFTTKGGLRYSLLFGEISGENEQKPAGEADKLKKAEVKEGSTGHNRYMSVFVQYDPAADLDAKAKVAEEAAKKAADEAAKKSADPAAPAAATPAPAVTPAVPAGSEQAAKEQKRFIQFFYVISDENFKALRPALDKQFEDKPKDPPPAASTGVTGAIGDALGLPPGTQPTPTVAPAPNAGEVPAEPAPAASSTPAP
jgi:Domain of unknown function (DUF4340)